MNKTLLVSILAILTILAAFTGCKKESAVPASESQTAEAPAAASDTAAPTADAKPAEEAPAEAKDAANAAPAPDAAPAKPQFTEEEIKTASAVAVKVFTEIANAANTAGDDCAKVGNDLNAVLEANKDEFASAMKVLATFDENSPEAKSVLAELDKIQNETNSLKTKMEKCQETPEVKAFTLNLISTMAGR